MYEQEQVQGKEVQAMAIKMLIMQKTLWKVSLNLMKAFPNLIRTSNQLSTAKI